jgi:hypothetical protein
VKVIDLLNKIAKGEEVPNIKMRDRIYKFCTTNFVHNDSGHIITGFSIEDLNDEIEIIEENKKLEKLNLDKDELLKNVIITAQDYVIEGKINELIDEVIKLKEVSNE